MIKVMFVCHGNICRSTMAEFVFKDLVKKYKRTNQFIIASAGTSAEELGNPVHHGTRKKLAEVGLNTDGKYAVQLKKQDYDNYDYFIGMDGRNIANMQRLFKGDPDGKVKLLLGYTGSSRDIADPWYTGDFDQTYVDVLAGCVALLEYILGEEL